MADDIQFWRHGDRTIVYLNGDLAQSGDHFDADEWLQSHVGVTHVDDRDGFCMDGHAVVTTVEEAFARKAEAKRRRENAEELRRQAQEMLAKADRIEKGLPA